MIPGFLRDGNFVIMNYQHSFHAGNFADVLKHAVLVSVLPSFHQKETPFCFIDTHAGAGCYDITAVPAQKTGEAKEGILKLLAAQFVPATPATPATQDSQNSQEFSLAHQNKITRVPLALKNYFDLVQKAQIDPTTALSDLHKITQYPGSPWLADMFCRAQDEIILNELHSETCRLLKRQFSSRDNVFVHQQDAYEFMSSVLPPIKIKRGLVLIDPPFERRDEEHAIAHALEKAHHVFPHGMYMIWFPLTRKHPVFNPTPKLQAVLRSPRWLGKKLSLNFRIKALSAGSMGSMGAISSMNYLNGDVLEEKGLIGSQLIIINPPYQLKDKLKTLMPYLMNVFAKDAGANWHLE